MSSPNEEPPQVQCSMCRGLVPASAIVRVSGRELCHSCAAVWFSEDEDGG